MRLRLDSNDLKDFKGSLFGFSEEQVQVKGYITLKTIFGVGEQAKQVKGGYMVIDAHSSNNIIIERPTFNQLSASLSTIYLCMKYPLSDRWVGVIQGDQ